MDNFKIKIGEELDVEIVSMTEAGEGITSSNGMILIIPGANVGQHVKVRIIEVGVTKAYCKLLDYL